MSVALFSAAASADDGKIPTSNLLIGDTVILRTTTEGFEGKLKADEGKKFTAPARTKFRVLNESGEGASKMLVLEVKDVPCSDGDLHVASSIGQVFSSIRVDARDCKAEAKVVEGHRYELSKSALDDAGYKRLGFIYGGLVIPYKYYRHDKSFEPATTLGPFVGYRFGQTGWGVSAVATYAATTAKLKVVSDAGAVSEVNTTGVSRGIGFMFDITKSELPFRAGVMWGKDRFGKKYEPANPHIGKSWMALQIGWEFGR